MGDPKKGNPHETCILAGASSHGGLRASVCSPAQKNEHIQIGNARFCDASSYASVAASGNTDTSSVRKGAISSERRAPTTCPSPNAIAFLGINGRTPAALQPRGFQPIADAQNLVEEVDPDTGEITRFEVTAKGRRVYKVPQQLRAERYALKSVVNRIFPKSLTAKCCRMPIPHQSVRILKTPEYNKAHYAGLSRCSSVWLCPVCAAKIAERRRAELVAAVATAKAMGWQVMLMTCTVPHGLGDDVGSMLDQMLKAWRKMTDSRKGKELRKLFDLRGTIRTLEVTDGQNGFHPHFHALLFIGSKFSSESVQAGFLPLWQDACVKAGLPCPSDYRGLRVDDGSWAAKYASKWGLEDEMVRGHMKTSKGYSGVTPWDMLRDILQNCSQRSEQRFRLYAAAFKGRRQLYWSNGLKAKLGVEVITDEELVAIEEETAYVLAEFTVEQWRIVLATRTESALLDIAEENPDQIHAFIIALAIGRGPPALLSPAHLVSEN